MHFQRCLSVQVQFGNFGSLEQHGFARNRLWSLDSNPSPLSPSNSQSSVDLILKSTQEDVRTWPRRYACALMWYLHQVRVTWKGVITCLYLWIYVWWFSADLSCGSVFLSVMASSRWSPVWEIQIASHSLLCLLCVTTYLYRMSGLPIRICLFYFHSTKWKGSL